MDWKSVVTAVAPVMGTALGGEPDFPGAEVVTMSAGGPGALVDVLKCRGCGHSVAPPAVCDGRCCASDYPCGRRWLETDAGSPWGGADNLANNSE